MRRVFADIGRSGLAVVFALVAASTAARPARAAAAVGTVRGTVLDATSHDPVPGAIVSVEGTDLTAATDDAGAYLIRSIPVGKRTVVATAAGYDSQSRPVTVGGSSETTLDFALSKRGSLFVEVPHPLEGENPTFKLVASKAPAAGQTVVDPRLGTSCTRVVQTEGVRHEYSRFDPFNSDQSMILLVVCSEGEFRVYRTASVPYDKSENLVMTLNIAEPRWDPSDPNVLWGSADFSVVTVDVKTRETTTIKDFSQDATIGPILKANPDLYHITMKDEGESSTDKRFWAFLIQGTNDDYRPRYLFTWDRKLDKILGLYPISAKEAEIDWVGMSPKGNWVVIGGDWSNGGKLVGLTIANKALTEFHRIDYTTAHSDVGLDSDGNEVIVMQNVRTDYIDMIPLDPASKPILEPGGSYENTNRVPLMRLFYASDSPHGFNSGVHISCNLPGYCVVSTSTEENQPDQNWLDRTITLVTLDGHHPRVFYLSKVHATDGAYWEETQATITNDGGKIVWASNWNQHVGEERVWLMQLTMPAGWIDALKSER
jgi:hypothetical protein